MKKIEKSIELAGKKLTLSTGSWAKQATGSVLASYGETVVLATVVAVPLSREIDYFPLSIEYQERLYAGGRIKGSRWIKREGRPSDEEILTGRLIDRSIRPLFDKYYKKELQVIVTVLSVDLENSPDVLAAIATSAAISISSIPWSGPVGVVKVGLKDGKFILNPTIEEEKTSELDLVVSSTRDAVVMIEAGANQVPEKTILEGIKFASDETQKILKLISDLESEVKPEKEVIEKPKLSAGLEKKVAELCKGKLDLLAKGMAVKESGGVEYEEFKSAVADNFDVSEKAQAVSVFENLFKKSVRDMLLAGKRLDGRKMDEIRELSAEVGVLPRTHGSAVFNRGQTQALTITTLGAPSLELFIESAEGEETKRYIHHYSFPPYSVGEVGKVGSPSRREIGHGALAERALLPVIPNEDEFPYTIRVVSEILGSNGSSSMASTCGSTLSLMDAGVPIKAPVAGIAMGLIVESQKEWAVLTDIAGLEDFNGDMDFKVAGTGRGITALQLDVKTLKLTLPILEKALDQALEARLKVLDVILKTIPQSRKSVSTHAPKIKVVKIPVEKIGELIGPGGRMIKSIIAETGALIDVEDDGTVNISGVLDEEVQKALDRVNAIIKEPKAGEIYDGIVKRIQPFGAFVEILPGKDGMVHVSDMSTEFVKDPADVVSIGDKVQVRVKEIDDLGRINLSMVMDPSYDSQKAERRERGSNNDRSFGSDRPQQFGRSDRGQRGGYQRGSFGNNTRGRYPSRPDREERGGGGFSKGPHFPTSRFLNEKKD